MAGRGWRGRKFLLGVAGALLLAAAGVGWVERTPLLTWFYLRGLARAGEADRPRWVERVAGLGEPAVPGLVDCLGQPDEQVCANAQAALERLTGAWGPGDARTADLALRLARAFARLSPAGQRGALAVAARWFPGAPAPGLVPACARLLTEAASSADPPVQTAALALGGALLAQPQGAEALRGARDLARAALQSGSADVRLRAIRLALHPGMDLLEQVVGLLRDPAPEVRRAAVVAVGPADQVVRDEGLLPCLHDPDPEVRRLCEVALRGRGLRPEHIHLGRLLAHPSPVTRLEVLDHLRAAPDLDPGLWLRRLSHDPSPAVRVAAMRAMSQLTTIDLSDRLDQMARNDPNPTVCQLARFYLRRPDPVPR